jgi:HlyD family secretion protein
VAFTEVPPTGLRQNQRVETRLILDSRENVLKIPRGPFLESLGGRQAYVVENGVATLKPIRAGSVSVTEVEITSGLNEGDEIVLSDLTRFEGAKSILLRD